MGIRKGTKKSRNLRLLNFDFGTFLELVGLLQCRELLHPIRIVFT